MLIEKPLVSSRITVRNYQKSDLPYLTAMWFDKENGKYMLIVIFKKRLTVLKIAQTDII